MGYTKSNIGSRPERAIWNWLEKACENVQVELDMVVKIDVKYHVELNDRSNKQFGYFIMSTWLQCVFVKYTETQHTVATIIVKVAGIFMLNT